jgi:hypothetical protein
MQSFAGKTINRTDKRLNQVLPFLVFAFGSIYAVAQFYFILQVAITRVELSIAVNATVFVTGILVMMMLIRRHVNASGTSSPSLTVRQTAKLPGASVADKVRRLIFHLFHYRPSKISKGGEEHSHEDAAPAVP